MKICSYLLKSGVFILLLAVSSAWTKEMKQVNQIQPFNIADFNKAKKEKKGIVLYVSASWCGYCKRQEPILKEVAQQETFKDIVFFIVNYDTSKKFLSELNVSKIPTVIVFQGEQEKDRFIGGTSQGTIEELVHKVTYKDTFKVSK